MNDHLVDAEVSLQEECPYKHACRGDHDVCQRKAGQVCYRLLAKGQCSYNKDCMYSLSVYLALTPEERELLKPWACAEAEKATANYRLKQIRVLKARK